MDTPIADFVRDYADKNTVRLHMPGHKGRPFLGCERLDITEVSGADALYEAGGIIARSEENATALFSSGRTVYSTEGSSQCIRAMLYLAVTGRPEGTPPVVVAARNVHKSFSYAAALLDFETVWLPVEEDDSLCSCRVSKESLERTLSALEQPPAAVYVTSPDYLGVRADISSLAEVCHGHGTVLAVDNAHGAYLRFLEKPAHPLDLGADICCDSAHKTLPVLTGGAYLHIGKNAPASFRENAKAAMAIFGSTSPSYLTLMSLDVCNGCLAGDYPVRLAETVKRLDDTRARLAAAGWRVEATDPLRITVRAPARSSGTELAHILRAGGIECEFADPDFLVLMATPENSPEDFSRLCGALGENKDRNFRRPPRVPQPGERVLSAREALFGRCRTIPADEAAGHICGGPTVSCPPAVPIAAPGERITREAAALFGYYGINTVEAAVI
ncbi:MAG: amino acid decarboxylase [Candidatus Heteroscillospira sp.]|jgi:arginine decarboxylase